MEKKQAEVSRTEHFRTLAAQGILGGGSSCRIIETTAFFTGGIAYEMCVDEITSRDVCLLIDPDASDVCVGICWA